MCELLLKGIANSIIIVIGVVILSNVKYRPIFLISGFLTMVAASSFTFSFGYQVGITSLFTIVFIFSRFTKDKWRYSLFIVTNIFLLTIVSKYWSNFFAVMIMYVVELPHEHGYLHLSLLIQVVLAIAIFRLVLRVFEGIGVHLFLDTLDRVASRTLVLTLFALQFVYLVISFIPDFLGLHRTETVIVQTSYVTLLIVMAGMLLVFFRRDVKQKIDLVEQNEALEQVNNRFNKVNELLEDKERLLSYLDQQISSLSRSQQKLLDFEHDQLNFMITLEAGINSGDELVMRQSLEQYGAAVSEVLEVKSEAPDVSGIAGSLLMPLRHFILTKSHVALTAGIKFTVEIPEEITTVGMDLKDFVRILGIWLDNAIEEAIHLEDPWIHLSFIKGSDEEEGVDFLEVRVSNSCRPKLPIDITKIYEQNESSKGENRGRGLRIVNDLLFQHDHIHLSTSVKPNDTKFTQLLSIAYNQE